MISDSDQNAHFARVSLLLGLIWFARAVGTLCPAGDRDLSPAISMVLCTHEGTLWILSTSVMKELRFYHLFHELPVLSGLVNCSWTGQFPSSHGQRECGKSMVTPSPSSAVEEPRVKHGCCQAISQATLGDVAIGPLLSGMLVAMSPSWSQQSNPQQTQNSEWAVSPHLKMILSFPAEPWFSGWGYGKEGIYCSRRLSLHS